MLFPAIPTDNRPTSPLCRRTNGQGVSAESQSMKALSVLALLLPTLIGCGGNPKTCPVSGTVEYSDGKPVTSGTIEFETIGRKPPVTATGEISESGTFVLGTFRADDGVLPGKHRAVVVSDFEIGTTEERPGLIPKRTVHSRYRDFDTSELEFDISSETNSIKVVVDYAEK